MKMVIILFVVAMVVKDVKFIGDAYWIRGITQVSLLILSLYLIFTKANFSIFKKHYLVFLYIFLIFISILYSPFKTYTFLQVASLCAPLAFFMGLTLLSHNKQMAIEHALFSATIYAYLVACVVSLILYAVAKGTVIEVLWANELRFTGVFSEPAMMGLISGLVLGLALLKKMNIALKIVILSVSMACLFLTLSRTFFIALIISALLTAWFYYPHYRKWYVSLAGVMFFLIIALVTQTLVLGKKEQKNIDSISRADSISNLSGRTAIWNFVINERAKNGFLGEGFSMGGALLLKKEMNSYVKIDPRAVGRVTMHSGYIQALADIGYPGLILYCSIILLAFYRAFVYDKTRQHGLLFFSLIYLAISNSAESVIYTAATFPSLLFWCLVIFAGSLQQQSRVSAYKAIHKSMYKPI